MYQIFKYILALPFFLIFSFFSETCIAQEQNLQKILKAELGLQGIGIGYELPLSSSFLAEFNIGVGGGINVNNKREVTYTYSPGPSIQASTSLRWYYDLNKRRKWGKNTANNAGNYFAFKSKFSSRGLFEPSPEETIDYEHIKFLNDALITEVHWGLQRSLSERIFLNGHIGFGYIRDFRNNMGTFSPTFGFKFGYRLNKFDVGKL